MGMKMMAAAFVRDPANHQSPCEHLHRMPACAGEETDPYEDGASDEKGSQGREQRGAGDAFEGQGIARHHARLSCHTSSKPWTNWQRRQSGPQSASVRLRKFVNGISSQSSIQKVGPSIESFRSVGGQEA